MKEHLWIKSREKLLSVMLHRTEVNGDVPIVIMCHGFTGEKVGSNQRNLRLANFLTLSGFHALRFDFAGSGESEGDFAEDTSISGWLEDLQNVIAWVKQQPDLQLSPIYLLGHSLGGCIVLLYQDQNLDGGISGRIALAPVIHPATNFRETIIGPDLWEQSLSGATISHFYGTGYSLHKHFVQDLVEQAYSPIERAASYREPVLLIHGSSDVPVPKEGSEEFYREYQGEKELVLFENGDHGFTGLIHELQEIVVDWLKRHSASDNNR